MTYYPTPSNQELDDLLTWSQKGREASPSHKVGAYRITAKEDAKPLTANEFKGLNSWLTSAETMRPPIYRMEGYTMSVDTEPGDYQEYLAKRFKPTAATINRLKKRGVYEL